MSNREDAGVVCIGGAVVDRKFHLDADASAGFAVPNGAVTSSLRSRSVHGFGGVARNVACNLHLLGHAPVLVSYAGDDLDGDALVGDLVRRGIDARFVARVAGATTAQYVAVLDARGELVFEIADMTIFERFASDDRLTSGTPAAAWVFADANLPAAAIAALAARAGASSYRFAVDAVSRPRASSLPRALHGVDVLFLNEAEAAAYLGVRDAGDAAVLARAVQARGAAAVVLTRGARGAIVATGGEVDTVAAIPAPRVVDVTGAGDALVAATLARLLARSDPRGPVDGAALRAAVAAGVHAAALTIASGETVIAQRASATAAS